MSEMGNWYQSLIKPSWSPPAWLFGPVWTVLYILIIISFGKVIQSFFKKEIPFLILLPFILNIIFNLIFTPLQFGLRSNLLAAIDITLVLITLIWAMVAIYPTFRWVTFMQIPYLMWVSLATVLQLSILFLN
ncbi:MAG: tryptophan-rich sensory protein [Candidatus Shapirobacteria bacterium]|jgi:tryptophan-rich sensory protein|nr:tryptophan-rich sensory protein [Candidatus Shapirobacteria bacterium]